jgi:hypothetical protein
MSGSIRAALVVTGVGDLFHPAGGVRIVRAAR